MAPTRLRRHRQSQETSEKFKEYAQRWREMASWVRLALLDNELIDIFMGTLQGFYYEKMVGSFPSNFADLLWKDGWQFTLQLRWYSD